MSRHLIFDIVVSIIETNMNSTPITKRIFHSSCAQINQPVVDIHTSPKANNDDSSYRLVTYKTINTSRTVLDNFSILEREFYAKITAPVLNLIHIFIGNGCEVS
jgi:hypothetical protein